MAGKALGWSSGETSGKQYCCNLICTANHHRARKRQRWWKSPPKPKCGKEIKCVTSNIPFKNRGTALWLFHCFHFIKNALFSSVVWEDKWAVLCLVAQLCPTLCDPMDCSPPGSSVRGDSPGKNAGVGSLSLLQGIFPTQGSNPVLLHWRQILYQLSYQGSP